MSDQKGNYAYPASPAPAQPPPYGQGAQQNYSYPPPPANASYQGGAPSYGAPQQPYGQDSRYGGSPYGAPPQQGGYYSPQPAPNVVYMQQQPQKNSMGNDLCLGCALGACMCCCLDAIF
ncbi:uncharacterized protein VTP21DRAFT_7964 [Calcarisporiella thermophila]|uniref:uncharacterized protein n=1 Tax=Calcarisporiella thermophila TaxID=911321 RepID=UPI0037446920